MTRRPRRRMLAALCLAAAASAPRAPAQGPAPVAIPPVARSVDELRAAVLAMPSAAPQASSAPVAYSAPAPGPDPGPAAPPRPDRAFAAAPGGLILNLGGLLGPDESAASFRVGYPATVIEGARKHVSAIRGASVPGPEAVAVFTDREAGGDFPFNQESIIYSQPMYRPALLVCSNRLADADPVPPFWAPDVERAAASIGKTLESTGFLSCPGNPGDKPGTCFVVGPDLVLTNRHVARSFAEIDDRVGGPAPLLKGRNSRPYEPTIDFARFRRACSGPSKTAFKVREIVHIEPETGLDVAILRVERRDAPGNALPPPLPLAGDRDEPRYAGSLGGRRVFLVGYPFMDWRETFDAQRAVFGDEFEVKRLALGLLTPDSRSDGLLAHDCSTLGGNSGSPVCDIGSGQVIGLHFRGRSSEADDQNYAIPLWALYKSPGVRAALLGQDPSPGAEPTPGDGPAPYTQEEPGRAGDEPKEDAPPRPTAPPAPDDGAPTPYTPGIEARGVESAPRAEEAPPSEYLTIAFDEQGRPVDEAQLARALSAPTPPTDVFVLSHGWNNSPAEADRSYRRLIARMAAVADRHALRPAGYRPLIVGVRWPSKAWVDEAAASSSAEAAATGLDPRLALAVYENFPRGQSSDAQHARDVLLMQELLAAPAGAPDAESQALALYRRYALADPDEPEGAFGEPRAAPALPAEESGFSILDSFRVFTYWQMKARAGVVGRNGVRSTLERLQERYPGSRMHLFGHSFGAKVLLAALGDRPLPRAVDTLALIQPAVSYVAMAERTPGSDRPGGYRRVAVEEARVRGPIVVTFSRFDEPLNRWYPLASRVAGQVGERFEAAPRPDKYAALGGVGAYSSGPRSYLIPMASAGVPYANPFSRAIWSVDGGRSRDEFIGGHSDLDKDSVAWLLWSAVRASFPAPPR